MRSAAEVLPGPQNTSSADPSLIDRRILLVSANYAPEFAGIGPYATGLAEHLASVGARVRVLTLMPHYPQWEVAQGYAGRLQVEERINGVELHRIWNVVSRKQTALTRAAFEGSFFLHAGLQIARYRPELVLAIVPSLGGAYAAAMHAKRAGVPFGAVVQDLMGAAASQSGIPFARRLAGAATRGEKWLFDAADGVAVICNGFRDRLLAMGVPASKIRVIRNWSHVARPRARQRELRNRLGWAADEFVIVHSGNMGHKQALENVVEAARLVVPNERIRFVLMGDGSQRTRLEGLASGIPSLSFAPPQSAEDFPDVLAAANALLVNERRSVTDMSLPSKLTSYCASGVPIIAAVAGNGTTANELREANAALITEAENPGALVNAVRQLRSDAALSAELARNAGQHLLHNLTAGAALAHYSAFASNLLARRAIA